MLKLRTFDTNCENFVNPNRKGWSFEGPECGKEFNALWVERVNMKPMWISFTKDFMQKTEEGEPYEGLFSNCDGEVNQIEGTLNIYFKSKVVHEGSDREKTQSIPMINFSNSNKKLNLLAFKIFVKDDEMISNIKTSFGVNNYSVWIDPNKSEAVFLSSFENDESYIEIFVQNMETNMVTPYYIFFNKAFTTEEFPSSPKFKIPDRINVPIAKNDVTVSREYVIIMMEDDDLDESERKIFGNNELDIIKVDDSYSVKDLKTCLQQLSNEYNGRKVVLVRTSTVVTGLAIMSFRRGISIFHEIDEMGTLVKVV